MSAVFSPALARGLGASSVLRPSTSSPLGPHLVAQKHGDPNYYATTPEFDSRGFWHSAGTNPPTSPPKGNPSTPAQGEWLQQGTTTRNGQTTAFWAWYPPKDKTVTIGSHKPGERNYLVSRQKMSNSKQLFFNPPEYWAHEYVVAKPPPAPKSSYKPQALQYDTVEGIVPVVGTFLCQHWLLVATQNVSRLNATLPGGLFSPAAVFNYYMKYETVPAVSGVVHPSYGLSPYFTWKGYLFRFEYTGYDPKTGTYRHGNQYKNIISLCTDGLDVQKNPSGSATNYTVYQPSGGSGGELVVHQPRGMHGLKETSMELRRDSAFNTALLRGLGLSPAGLGQLSQLTAGGNGTVQMLPFPVTSIPKVLADDWVEFYPNDPDSFRPNTNLAVSTTEQSSAISGSSPFYGANPVGGAIVDQAVVTTPLTTYWSLVDPNNRAAYTIGAGGNETGDGSSPGIAILRSSFNSKGALKLEIALRVAPHRVDQFATWPSKATVISDNSVLESGVDWVQELGPVGGNLTAADMPGQTIALTAGGKDIANVVNSYLKCISQPQYLQTMPSAAWGQWAGFGVARGGYLSIPTVYFTYGGQTYKIFWYGGWVPGQVGGAPNSGPAISVAVIVPKPPPAPPKLTVPTTLSPVPQPPAWATPVRFPGGGPIRPTGPMKTKPSPAPPASTVPVTAGGLAPVPAITSAAIAVAPPGMSPAAAVALGLLGTGLLGGVLYLVFE